jgi:hypothetical protein
MNPPSSTIPEDLREVEESAVLIETDVEEGVGVRLRNFIREVEMI